jgi:integral membrane protein
MNGAIKRFRFMALWAGGFSILLWFVYMPAKYLVTDPTFYEKFIWIPIVHGFTYPIYLLATLQMCYLKRKSLINTALYMLAGTLPIASIWAERKVRIEEN